MRLARFSLRLPGARVDAICGASNHAGGLSGEHEHRVKYH